MPPLSSGLSPSSRRRPHLLQTDLSFGQHPRPDTQDDGYNQETEHKNTPKHDGVVRPSIFGRHAYSRYRDRPWKHPERVDAQSLEEVPSWNCCEQDRRNLCIESVKDIAPIDCLRPSDMRKLGTNHLPHLRSYFGHLFGPQEVEGEFSDPPKREKETEWNFDSKGDSTGDPGVANDYW